MPLKMQVFKRFLFAVLLSLACALPLNAQFRENAFTQSYNDDTTTAKDSADVLFSFKDFFGGVSHKHEIKIGVMFAGSTLFLGSSQIYNRDYWKLPLVYTGILAPAGMGIYQNLKGNHDAASWWFVGAGLAYWGALMDGVISYEPSKYPHAGKATLYSLLVPGLGQIYNHEAWKIPLYWGIIGGGVHFYFQNRTNYLRFQRIYKEMTDSDPSNDGPVSAETALYYRNVYRRYRDYSMLVIFGGYLLQIIDANVFSYMHDFNVSDDLSIKLAPTIMPTGATYALGQKPAIGMRFGLSF